MNSYIELVSEILMKAFEKSGYDASYGKATWSNRPDLCDVQCNGALVASKVYKKSPQVIAKEVVENIENNGVFETIEVAGPGFINVVMSNEFTASYINKLTDDIENGMRWLGNNETIVIDYGGPNVAKPLHIGHLRPAIIGESIKLIKRYCGYNVIGDVHLGDWGYQMGLIIEALVDKYSDALFSKKFDELGIDVSLLEKVYPSASARAKEDEEFAQRAHKATFLLQNKNPEYYSVWKKIVAISIEDLKKNYLKLNVEFDLWYGESDAQDYIPRLLEILEKKKCTRLSDGALVVDVQAEDDKIEIPPCIIVKSDGAYLYSTTDLATIIQREEDFNPVQIIYVVDMRQELHFKQVFRCAKKAEITSENTDLIFIGFGTMNGKDGKPFKTREGGVMRLESLLGYAYDSILDKYKASVTFDENEISDVVSKISLAAIKYGDLSNQASKNYNFDIDRFCDFEGNTGPYILYTIVRIKSLLRKCMVYNNWEDIRYPLKTYYSASERELQLKISKFFDMVSMACSENAPHRICQYIYDVSNSFNSFYHSDNILNEKDEAKKMNRIALLFSTLKVLEKGIELLGLEAPEKM